MRHKTSVGARLWAVIVLCLGVGAGAGAVLIYESRATVASYESTLQDLQARGRQQDAARVMQDNFKKEVQEWKDALLRGYNAPDLEKYQDSSTRRPRMSGKRGWRSKASLADPEASQAGRGVSSGALGTMRQVRIGVESLRRSQRGKRARSGCAGGIDRAATDLIDKIVDASVSGRRPRPPSRRKRWPGGSGKLFWLSWRHLERLGCWLR